MLYIQKPKCGNLRAPCRWTLDKPESALLADDEAWERFSGSIFKSVAELHDEKHMLVVLAGIPLLLLTRFTYLLGESDALKIFSMVFPMALCLSMLFLIMLMRGKAVKKNAPVDREIEQTCQEFAHASGLQVEYRTKFVGHCRPRGTQPFRAIAISEYMNSGPQRATECVAVGFVVD